MTDFLLQPLVENALKHGIGARIRGGRITIAAVRDGDHVRIDRIASIHTQDIGGYLVELIDGTQLRSSRAYNVRIRSLLR